MKKIWYIDIAGRLEGPYTPEELKRNRKITPDTLVWKEGMTRSTPARKVPELKFLFVDEVSPNPPTPEKHGNNKKVQNDLMIMEMSQEPPFLMWVIIFIALLIVAWYTRWH